MKFRNEFVNIVSGIPQHFRSYVAFENRLIIRAFLIIRLQHSVSYAHIFHRRELTVPHGERGIPPVMARIVRSVFPHHEIIRNRRPLCHVIRSVRITVLRFVVIRCETVHIDRRKTDHYVFLRHARGIENFEVTLGILLRGGIRRPLIRKHHHVYIAIDFFRGSVLRHTVCQSVDKTNHHSRVGIRFRIGNTLLAQTRTGEEIVLPEHIIIIFVGISADHFAHSLDCHTDRRFALRAVFVRRFGFVRAVGINSVGIAKIRGVFC